VLRIFIQLVKGPSSGVLREENMLILSIIDSTGSRCFRRCNRSAAAEPWSPSRGGPSFSCVPAANVLKAPDQVYERRERTGVDVFARSNTGCAAPASFGLGKGFEVA
jgi:hypothetical protein